MDSHREACRRQHRVLGHFLAVQTWLRNLDCLALARRDLEVFLGLERFKVQRVNWLREDLEPWFPHQESYTRLGTPSSLHSLFISRVPISEWLPQGSMTTEERIAAMKLDAPRTAIFAKPTKGQRLLREKDVVQYLAILDSGLSAPEPLSGVPLFS